MKSSLYLVVPFAAWLVAQVLKFMVRAIRGDIDWRMMYVSGGMPSAHSAVVTSLTTVALILNGPTSPEFGVTAVLAGIVMYDALGVRRMAGEHAILLRKLTGHLNLPPEPKGYLKGHTPTEVVGGIGLGLVMAVLFNTTRLQKQFHFLSASPNRTEIFILAGLFAAVVVGGWIYRLVLSKRYRGSTAAAKVSGAVLLKTQVIGWIGLLLGFAAYEKASYLDSRVWLYVIVLIALVWDFELIRRYRGSLGQALAHEAEQARKERWLKAAKRTK